MTISGLGTYDYNKSYSALNRIPVVNEGVSSVKGTGSVVGKIDATEISSAESSEQSKKIVISDQEKSASGYSNKKDVLDFAVGSTAKAEFNLVGADSSLEDLDMQKAISDMQRDNIIQEYQYFVKSSLVSADGNNVVKMFGME